MRHRRLLASGTLGAVLATLLIAGEPAGANPTPPPAGGANKPASAPATPEPARSVTLLTGDRVSIAAGQLTVTPREGVQFFRYRRDEADYVVPSDALPLLRADRLDERLFNVTALLEYEFDKLPYLPLVVSDTPSVRGLATQQRLAAVDGFATKVPVADLAKTWEVTRASLSGGKIWLDGVRESMLDVSAPMIGAPTAWSAGYDGTGVTVAVLDTGIDDTHPDLAGAVVARRNFVPEMETALDLNGHGTHVASTIAGSGAASGGRYKGVAPGADLLDAKVCWNVGGRGACSDSAILAAMQWAVDSGAKVVNMSLGGPDEIGVDPLEQAINEISAEHGILFVCSAGNVAIKPEPVGSPSTADAALSVANFDKNGNLNWSSLQGPRAGDYAVKPDIGGPGTDIFAARSPSALDHLPAGEYVPLTGTSMASPHVAGAAALLAQANPGWKGEQIKETLMASAVTVPELDVFAAGAGIVNVAQALDQDVTVTPASLSVGALEWPHDEAPGKRTVTYHNRGDAPVTLDLAFDGNAPEGLLTLGATSLTVPAGGEASVDVVVDEQATEAYGYYSGRLVATGDGVTLRTPFSVYLEAPSASLRLKALDRHGRPAETVMITIINPDPQRRDDAIYYSPTASRRAPLNSTWHVTAFVVEEDETTTMVTTNKVVVTKDTEVVLDARRGRPLDIRIPEKRATAYQAGAVVSRTADGLYTHSGITGDLDAIRTADVGPKNLPGVVTQVHSVFQGKPEKGRAPDVYQVGWRTEGSFITGFTKHVKRHELATVEVGYPPNATGVQAWRANVIEEATLGGAFPLSSELPPVTPPAQRTEYYLGGVPWRSSVYQESTEDESLVLHLAQTESPGYRAGRRYAERWGGAVFNTTLKPAYPGSYAVTRQGNTIWANFHGLSDGDGHVATSPFDTDHRVSLHRGDELLGEFTGVFGNFGSWEVGAEPAEYRLTYAAQLPAQFPLSPRMESVWTFTSSAEQENELPLTSIGFQPDLRPDNSARAGGTLLVPLTFAHQGAPAKVKSASVSVSYDDGATWSAVPTLGLFGSYTAIVSHPKRKSGFVSLRATATDAKGNTVSTTVLRAYRLT